MNEKKQPTLPANRGQGRHKLKFKTVRVTVHLEEAQAEKFAASGNGSEEVRNILKENGWNFKPITDKI